MNIAVNALDALQRANAGLERRLRLIRADDWLNPTPCTEWNVRALVNHVIGGNRRYVLLLHGATAQTVDRTRTLDHIGEDPVGSFTATADDLLAAFRAAGALDRTVHHPLGDRSGSELLAMRVVDVTVHTWDLARALADDDTLDPVTVEYALAHTEVLTWGREHGSYLAPTSATLAGQSPQGRLLHLAGRSPMEDQP